MIRCARLLLAAGLVAACAAGLRAAESLNAKLLGTWTHHSGAYRVRLEVKPDRLHCTIAGPDGIAFTLDADYVVSKDGIVLGIIRARDTDKQDEDALQDRLFYFRVTARERTLAVSQLSCGDDDDKTKAVLEGTYVRHAGTVSHADKRPHSRAESKAPSDEPNGRIWEKPSRPQGEPTVDPEWRHPGSRSLEQVADEWESIWNFFVPSSAEPCNPSWLAR